MEDRMSLRNLRKAVLFALAAAVVPACGGKEDKSPVVVRMSPDFFTTGVARCPIIYVQFNKSLDPATVTPSTVFLDSPIVNEGITVTYNDALKEIRIVPTTDLAADTDHQVWITTLVESADGHASRGELLYFRTAPTGTVNRPSFAGVDAVSAPGPTSIKVDWLAATDPDATTVTYDVFISTVSGGEDMTKNPKDSVTALTSTITGLISGTEYFVKVRARNSAGNLDINNVEMSVTTP
jgi:Big-like domain-containing protein/fibronectin type III domain protein